MDNHGSEANGQHGRSSAEAFTAEIERATNAELEWKLKQSGIAPDVAQKLGSTVISGEDSSVNSANVGLETSSRLEGLKQAEREILRDQAELEEPEAYVGDESELQIEERSEEDQEDLQHEMGEGLKFEVKAMRGGQEEVAKAVMPEVDKIINQSSFRVRDLEDLYHEGVNKMLLVFNRRIGDRNGVNDDKAKAVSLNQADKGRHRKWGKAGKNNADIVSLGQHLDEQERDKVVKNVA